MPTIVYHGDARQIVAPVGTTLLQASLEHQIPHMHACGGLGRCTTCRVRVLGGHEHLSPPTPAECAIAQARQWDDLVRLACQATVCSEHTVQVQRLIRNDVDAHKIRMEALPGVGSERPLAVLLSDIRGFTRFARGHLPFDVLHLLNDYFALLGEAVLQHHGYIDKYIGDGMLALFGLEAEHQAAACADAVRTALAIQQQLETFHQRTSREFGVRLETGIGLHYGPALTGVVGHPARTQFTAIGDTVNMATRIEACNKVLGTRVLASEQFHQQVADRVESRPRGLSCDQSDLGQVTLYEICAWVASDNPAAG